MLLKVLIVFCIITAINACGPPTRCCGANEILTCGSACDNTCDLLDIPCTIINVKCTTMCRCKPGYARDSKNNCILAKYCPKPKCNEKMNEIFSCGSACDTTCATLNKPCPVITATCVNRCRCKKGFARDSKNICIPVKQCPPLICKETEELNTCPIWCTFEPDCPGVLGVERICEAPPPDFVCEPRCECRIGLVRIDGACVPEGKCCTEPNTELGVEPKPDCVLFCNQRKCICKSGYIRDEKTNKCVSFKDRPIKCPAQNTEYRECGSPCRATCQNRNPFCNLPCRPGCYCKKGFVMMFGRCERVEKCPPICKETEVMNKCPGWCTFDRDCDTVFGFIRHCNTPPPNYPCKPRCECREGLARINGACVPEGNCCTEPNTVLGVESDRKTCICQIGYERDENNVCFIELRDTTPSYEHV